MADTYTASASPASVAARLAALEVSGGGELRVILLRLFALVLTGAQTTSIPSDPLTLAKAATVLEGTPLPDVSIYQALFGTVPDGTGPAEGRQKFLKGTGRSLFERLFADLDDEMLRFEDAGQPRPLAQMVFGAEPGTSNSDVEDHAEILKGGGRSLSHAVFGDRLEDVLLPGFLTKSLVERVFGDEEIPAGGSLAGRIDALEARIEALEAWSHPPGT